MENSGVIFWTLMLFAAAVAVAMPSDHRKPPTKRDLNKELTDALKRFPCKAPQERFISLNELVPNRMTTHTYLPSGAVLHRCDHEAGWCRNNDCKCGPGTIVDVDLVFQVLEDSNPRGKYEIVQAKNHTECVCLTLYDTPK